jgi:hypothetical protein
VNSILIAAHCLLDSCHVISANVCSQNLRELVVMAVLGTEMSGYGYGFDTISTLIHLPQFIQISFLIFLREQPIDNIGRHLINKPFGRAWKISRISLHNKLFHAFIGFLG